MKKILTIALLSVATIAGAQTSMHDKDSLANMPAFKNRVKIATLITADTRLNTIDSSFCRYVKREPELDYWIKQLSYAAALSGTTWTDSDATLQATINTLFPTFALIFRSK